MSIFAHTGEDVSVTRDPIRLFTDRYQAIRDIASRINIDPPAGTIVFFIGLGGNGKTTLLRYLRESCCYRLSSEQWREVAFYSDDVFASALQQAPSAEPVAVAMLDFGMRPHGENRPQEAMPALFMIKRQLSRYKIRTPRFDLGALTYYRKSGLDASALLPQLFPATELSLAVDIADTLLTLPVLRTGMNLYEAVNRRLDDVFSRRKLERRVPREVALRILSLPNEPELADELPGLFAADLGDALAPRGGHHRIVLMFDTYEAFLGEAVEPGSYSVDPGGPLWFRSLLGNLPIGDGVVAIVAGRTRPRWASAARARIPDRYVDFRPIGPLGAEFAETYLTSAGITDPPLRAALISYASVEPGQVHPYLLGLCADVALVAMARSTQVDPAALFGGADLVDRERQLAARLLSWVSQDIEAAIIAVSACRSFDLGIFEYLGATLGFPHRPADFRRLTDFSFVTPASRSADAPPGGGPSAAAPAPSAAGDGSGGYEVHRILRNTLAHIEPAATRAAHEALIAYYDQRSDETLGRVEVIYHRNQLDPTDGVQAWLAAMTSALAQGRFDLCRTYIALLPDLTVATEEERHACAYASARAELGLGRWGDAEQLLAGLPAGSAHALLLRADLAFLRGQFPLADDLTHRALRAAPAGDTRLPFLFRAAELYLFLGFHDQSRAICADAVTLAAAAEDPVVAGNEHCRFHNLAGEVAYFAGDLDTAKADFARAHAALMSLPEHDRDQALGAALQQNDALVAIVEHRWGDAERAQRAALATRRDIADARGIAHSLHGLGVALSGVGDHAGAGAAFAEASERAETLGDDLLIGKILRARGEAAITAGRYAEARELLTRAIDELTRIGIDYDVVHAELTMARLQLRVGNASAAADLHERARQVIERRKYLSLYRFFPEASVPPTAADPA